MMKFYFAGGPCLNTPADKFIDCRLLSYEKRPLNDAQRCADKGNELFLDSGAFSVSTQGHEIDIDRYAKFIQNSDGLWDHVANLDVIPGKGVSPASAAEKSYHNLRHLEERGCTVVPCFHMGEPYRYLERYIERYDYIALGGMVKARKELLASWLDWCWLNYLTYEDGRPRVKVHGFGLSSYWAATRYPWQSMDSCSWILNCKRMVVPAFVNGKPVEFKIHQEGLPAEVETRFDITTQQCREDYKARLLVNAAYYKELENYVPDRFLPASRPTDAWPRRSSHRPTPVCWRQSYDRHRSRDRGT